MKLTKAQNRIMELMREGAARGLWNLRRDYHGFALVAQHSQEKETPKCILSSREEFARNAFGRWPNPTYLAHVRITLTPRGTLLGVAPAPWVRPYPDALIPYWLAEQILEDPDLALELGRMAELQRARRARRAR